MGLGQKERERGGSERGREREVKGDREENKTEERRGRMAVGDKHMLHTRSSGKLLCFFARRISTSLFSVRPSLAPTTYLLLPLFLSVFLPLQLGNVRLTTQWKQQLHDRWSRPTDRFHPPSALSSSNGASPASFAPADRSLSSHLFAEAMRKGVLVQQARARALEFGCTGSADQNGPSSMQPFLIALENTFCVTSGGKQPFP